MPTTTSVSLHGTIVGRIWMPAIECHKPVNISERDMRYCYNNGGSRPTLRDMALRVCNDGDFRSCKLTADSVFVFRRIRSTGTTVISRTRELPVSSIRSVADCVDVRESWEFADGEEGEES